MVAILHEGKTDKSFFTTLFDAYGINATEDNIKYYNFEGIENIFKIGHDYYNEIENDNIISKMLIVIDADKNYSEHQKRLEELIVNFEFEDIEIDYFLMSDESKRGNLESFLLSVLDDEQKECIKKFRECYKYELTDKWAYNTFYKQKNYPFDFNHQNFNELKQKIQNLFN